MFVNVDYELIQEFSVTTKIDEAHFRDWADIGPDAPIDNQELAQYIGAHPALRYAGTKPIKTYEHVEILNAMNMGER